MSKKPRILFRRGFKYQLNQNYELQLDHIRPAEHIDVRTPFIELTPGGLLCVKYGYAWDGASGPTRDTPSSMRGSLVHDALYQLCRMHLLDHELWREEIDLVFWRICQTDGMGRFRAWYWHRAVRRYAESGATNEDRPVEAAPR